RLAVLMITSVLDQRYVGDPQTQEVPPVVQLCQGVLTLLCRSRIAGVDVGYAAGDDQFICMREQETAQAEGFVAECLWIPQGGVTKLFSALGQFDQLGRGQRIGKPKHPFSTEIHGLPPQKISAVNRLYP